MNCVELKVWLEGTASAENARSTEIDTTTTVMANQPRDSLPQVLQEKQVPLDVWTSTHDLLVETFTMFREESCQTSNGISSPGSYPLAHLRYVPLVCSYVLFQELLEVYRWRRQHKIALNRLVSHLADTYLPYGIKVNKGGGPTTGPQVHYDEHLRYMILKLEVPKPVGGIFCTGSAGRNSGIVRATW